MDGLQAGLLKTGAKSGWNRRSIMEVRRIERQWLPTAAVMVFSILLLVATVVVGAVVYAVRSTDSLRTAETNLYFHCILAAQQSWKINDIGSYNELLDDCPPDLRHWEWHYFQQLHESVTWMPDHLCHQFDCEAGRSPVSLQIRFATSGSARRSVRPVRARTWKETAYVSATWCPHFGKEQIESLLKAVSALRLREEQELSYPPNEVGLMRGSSQVLFPQELPSAVEYSVQVVGGARHN